MNSAKVRIPALIEHALHAAVRAPSPHNTQPWRFEVGAERVDVLLDRDRVLRVSDPDAREARLACGAAVLNLRLALHAGGRSTRLALLPDRDRPDLLASVRLGDPRLPSAPERELAAAIERRATNRRPFLDRAVPVAARHTLRRAADAEGAQLVLLDRPSELGRFAGLLRRADHLQETDPAFQVELLDWMAEHSDRDDGVPRWAGGPRPAVGSVLALRRYAGAESTVERPYEQDPLVAVLATRGDTTLDQLGAGLALQRVLLTATVLGLSVSFVSQPVEVRNTRAQLRDLIGGQHAQVALRIGYGYAVAQTPRRAVSTVTTATEPAP